MNLTFRLCWPSAAAANCWCWTPRKTESFAITSISDKFAAAEISAGRRGAMKSRRIVTLIVSCLFLGVLAPSLRAQANTKPAAKDVFPLDSGWEFRQKTDGPPGDTTKWLPAEVPGVVHTDLLRNKLIPDPFYRDNEAKLQWIENADWEYRKTFTVTPQMLAHQHIDLVFEGLDTIADVYLNDRPVISADNMFREWRADVKMVLKPGDNVLHIIFRSVFPVMKELQNEDPSFALTHAEGKEYIRK